MRHAGGTRRPGFPPGPPPLHHDPEVRPVRRLARPFSLLLLGWFAFVMGAVAYATAERRRAVPPDPASDELDVVAAFDALELCSTASAFRGGRVSTWFGGGTLDLRGATLAPGGATLRVVAGFGGGNLVVPEGWRVEPAVLGIFGGVGDSRPSGNPAAAEGVPTVRLEGVAMFGGWGISSETSAVGRPGC